MTKIRGILFDKDGTLFDFSATWVSWADRFLHRIAEDTAHAIELGQAIGFDLRARCFQSDSIAIAGTPTDIVDALSPLIDTMGYADLLDAINAEAAVAPQAESVPLRPLLMDLAARGMKLGVVTNDAEAPARAHLDAADATTCFDFIAGSDSGFGAKPAPGQLRAFATAMALAPQEILMVGDSLHDLFAARAADMKAVGVLTGMASPAELAPHALVVLRDIGQLSDWLAAQNLFPD